MKRAAIVLGLLSLLAAAASAQTPRKVMWNRPPLERNRFAPLPLGSIKPAGWLKNELRTQADGLSGHLDEFWPDLGPNSGWLGGTGESWERGPYYLDGLLPLAHLLDDARLIEKANRWVEWTLRNQRQNGDIGPDRKKGTFQREWQADDWWPNMVMLKVLMQHEEATGDPRVVPLMVKYLKLHLREAQRTPLVQWASFRSAEEMLAIVWLYNRTGDEELLNLARVLKTQSFDWNRHFADFEFTGKVKKEQASLRTHVVNNAMALKTPAVWWTLFGGAANRNATFHAIDTLDRYHGQANGTHAGDEHYAGLDPSQGTELCAVVEAMFSYEQLIAIFGEAQFGDRLERLAFNALPAAFKSDMWAHQYDQQVNQAQVSVDKDRNWTTNGPDSNIYGLEPNFGCCTANFHQGWPKYVSHLWMATQDDGLAAVAYGPSRVRALVAGGTPVEIEQETEYPFRGIIRMRVRPAKSERFPIQFRIPAWAQGATLKIGGRAQKGVVPGAFFRVDRTWKQGDTVELQFPMEPRVERRYRNSVALTRGPLVFSLRIGEEWKKIKGEEPHADWEVYPTTPWNFALRIEERTVSKSVSVEERPLGNRPFSPEGAPVVMKAQGRRLASWQLVAGSAGPLPESPAQTEGAWESLALIPYGSAKLRITCFPVSR